MSFKIKAGIAITIQEAGAEVISLVERNLQKLEQTGKKTQRSATGMDKAFTKLGAGGLRIAKAGFAALTVASVAFFAKSAQAAASFETRIAEIRTIATGAGFNIDKLAKSAQNFAVQFGTSNTEQAKAYYQAISSGARDTVQAQKLVASANKLAIAGLADTEPTLRAIVGAANAFGISLENADRVADVMFATVKKGIIQIPELAATFGQASVFSKKAGVSIEEQAAAIAALTKNGLSAELAVTAYKNAVVKLQAPNRQALKELKRLGIENIHLTLKTKGLAAALNTISSNSRVTTQSLRKIFGDVRGLAGALNLTGDSALTFADAFEAVNNSLGDVDEAAKIMGETTERTVKRLGAMSEKIGTTFGQLILKSSTAKGALERVRQVLADIDKFFESKAGQKFADQTLSLIKTAADGARQTLSGLLALVGQMELATAVSGDAATLAAASSASQQNRFKTGLEIGRTMVQLAKEEAGVRDQISFLMTEGAGVEQAHERAQLELQIEAIQKRRSDLISLRGREATERLVRQAKVFDDKAAKDKAKRAKELADQKAQEKAKLAADAAEEARRQRAEEARARAVELREHKEKELNKLLDGLIKESIKDQEREELARIKRVRREALNSIRVLAQAGKLGAARDILERASSQGPSEERLTEDQQQAGRFSIGRAQVRLNEKRHEELRKQAQQTAEAWRRMGQTMASSISGAVESSIEAGEGFSGVMKGIGKAAIEATAQVVAGFLEQAIAGQAAAQTNILASSATAGAKGAESASGLPFPLNLIMAPLVSGIMFALARGFLTKFHDGGEILGGMGRMGGSSAKGEVPIMAQKGEIVIPVDKIQQARNSSGGGGGRSGGTVIINQNSLIRPTNQVDARRSIRDAVMPAASELVDSGRASFGNKRFRGRRAR